MQDLNNTYCFTSLAQENNICYIKSRDEASFCHGQYMLKEGVSIPLYQNSTIWMVLYTIWYLVTISITNRHDNMQVWPFKNLANKVILRFSWNILNAITKLVWCKCTSSNTLQCGFSIEFLLLLRCRHHIWVFIFSLSLLYVSLMSSMREKKRSLRFYCKS